MSARISEVYWLKDGFFQDVRRSKELPKKVRVVVIGGGMTGVATVYWLQKNGISDVILLERRGICSGATGRNGGHFWPYYTPSIEDEATFGAIETKKAFDFQVETVQLMQDFLEELDPEQKDKIQFQETGAVDLYENQDYEQCLEEIDKINSRGYGAWGLEAWDHNKCCDMTHSSAFKSGIYQKFAGQFIPAQFVFALTSKIIELGANVQTNTEVIKVNDLKQGHSEFCKEVVTQNRGSIFAKEVVYATNAYTGSLLHELSDEITPYRGQVMATCPLNLRWAQSMNSDDEYIIQLPNRRLIFGGMRRKGKNSQRGLTNDNELDEDVSTHLRKFLSETFPSINVTAESYEEKNELHASKEHVSQGIPLKSELIEFEWTGIMGGTKDERPLIGEIRTSEFVAVGFSGNGMVNCFGAAKLIAELITGKATKSDIPKPLSLGRLDRK